MTKPSARQLLTDRLRTHMFKLQAGESFIAAKKKTQQQHEANAASLPASNVYRCLAHFVFISQIMPVTATSMDDASEVFEMLRFLVTMLVSFFTGCFCMWMFMDYPNILNRAEPKRRTTRPRSSM